MTKDHYIEILKEYESILTKAMVESSPTIHPFMSHMNDMCAQAIAHMETGKTEEAMRWLGFIEGGLWMMGVKALEDLKKDNKENGQHRTSREGRESVSPNRR